MLDTRKQGELAAKIKNAAVSQIKTPGASVLPEYAPLHFVINPAFYAIGIVQKFKRSLTLERRITAPAIPSVPGAIDLAERARRGRALEGAIIGTEIKTKKIKLVLPTFAESTREVELTMLDGRQQKITAFYNKYTGTLETLAVLVGSKRPQEAAYHPTLESQTQYLLDIVGQLSRREKMAAVRKSNTELAELDFDKTSENASMLLQPGYLESILPQKIGSMHTSLVLRRLEALGFRSMLAAAIIAAWDSKEDLEDFLTLPHAKLESFFTNEVVLDIIQDAIDQTSASVAMSTIECKVLFVKNQQGGYDKEVILESIDPFGEREEIDTSLAPDLLKQESNIVVQRDNKKIFISWENQKGQKHKAEIPITLEFPGIVDLAVSAMSPQEVFDLAEITLTRISN